MSTKQKRIEDILSELTPEERELHKDLINECLQREIDVDQQSKNIKTNLNKLNYITAKIVKDFNTIMENTAYIHNKLMNNQEKVTNYSNIDLRFIPEEEFIKA